ncbi:ATP-dependent metallopeptidase FtsH/Yme1/Tma family protein, partial [Streptomyces olivaceoviridis]
MAAPVPPRHDPRSPWRSEGVPGGPPAPNGRRSRSGCLVQIVVILVIYLGTGLLYNTMHGDGTTSIDYTDFTAQLDSGNVKTVYSQGSQIQGTLKKAREVPGGDHGATYVRFKTYEPAFADDDGLWREITRQKVSVSASPVAQGPGLGQSLLVSLLPTALLIAVWVFVARKAGGGLGGGMSGVLGRKPPKPVEAEQGRTTFADVAGIDEVEGELNDVVDFLKRPEAYRRMGAKMPRGV